MEYMFYMCVGVGGVRIFLKTFVHIFSIFNESYLGQQLVQLCGRPSSGEILTNLFFGTQPSFEMTLSANPIEWVLLCSNLWSSLEGSGDTFPFM